MKEGEQTKELLCFGGTSDSRDEQGCTNHRSRDRTIPPLANSAVDLRVPIANDSEHDGSWHRFREENVVLPVKWFGVTTLQLLRGP